MIDVIPGELCRLRLDSDIDTDKVRDDWDEVEVPEGFTQALPPRSPPPDDDNNNNRRNVNFLDENYGDRSRRPKGRSRNK